MSIKKEIPQGNPVPVWYGIAWITASHWDGQTAHCFPIPLNLLVIAARRLYFWAHIGASGAVVSRWQLLHRCQDKTPREPEEYEVIAASVVEKLDRRDRGRADAENAAGA